MGPSVRVCSARYHQYAVVHGRHIVCAPTYMSCSARQCSVSMVASTRGRALEPATIADRERSWTYVMRPTCSCDLAAFRHSRPPYAEHLGAEALRKRELVADHPIVRLQRPPRAAPSHRAQASAGRLAGHLDRRAASRIASRGGLVGTGLARPESFLDASIS